MEENEEMRRNERQRELDRQREMDRQQNVDERREIWRMLVILVVITAVLMAGVLALIFKFLL